MKKNKKLIIIIIAVLCLTIIAMILVLNNQNDKKITKEEVQEITKLTNSNIDTIESDDITYDKITSLIGKKVSNIHINVGPNSYLRNRPSEEVIEQYGLNEYIDLQEKLAQKVEKKYLDNLQYEIIDTKRQDNQVCQTVEITSYYYALYLHDLINLTNSLTTYDVEEVSQSVEAEVDLFKSQVKAMQVLDNHLNDYDNTLKETTTGTLCYVNQELVGGDNLLSFIGALQGETYGNCNFSAQVNITASDNRLKQYLQEAKEI